jgi:outer membrane translocation and assembly module TamA
MGSNLEVTATASYRTQEVEAAFNWYYAPIVTDHFIRTTYSYRRENERRHDTRTLSATVGPAWNADAGDVGLFLWPNVSYDHVETVRGEGDPTADFVWLNADGRAQSHEFEYYRADPRTGYELSAQASLSSKDAGSSVSARRYKIGGTKLWNLFDLSPPIWVFGVRGLAATIVPDDDDEAARLPPNFRFALGGSQNLRAFGRDALPPDDARALTIGYLGTEARLCSILPYGLQPIVFVDSGRIGTRALTFDPTLFWGPGVGLNWKSPVGTFRLTAAHGRIAGERAEELAYLQQWQVYFSYGEQF